MLRGRVAPRHHEHLKAVVEQVFHEAFVGRHVVHVELVDLRRNDEDRPRFDVRRRRAVLDQFEDRVAEYDGARRVGEVDADFERRFVHLRRHAAVVHRSSTKFRAPLTRLCAARLRAHFFSADGLPSRKFVGARPSVTSPNRKCARCAVDRHRSRRRRPIRECRARPRPSLCASAPVEAVFAETPDP